MIRSLLLALAATSTFGVAQAAAQLSEPQLRGHIGVGYMRAGTEVAGADLDTDFYSLEGALRFGADHVGGQVDGGMTYSELVPGFEETAWSGTLHINGRFEDTALLGAFAGVDNSHNLSVWGAGLEGQLNIGPSLILYAQGGYGRTNDLTGIDTDLWAARGEIRYFVTDDLKVLVAGGYQKAKDRFLRTDAWIGTVEGEYQLPHTPFSILASYSRYEINDLSTISNIFRVGGRYTFGGTLRERDRSGAGLGTVQRLFSLDYVRN